MRKLIAVGLLVGGLLAMAGPAMAQVGGIADPLTLAASGVLMPFFGAPGDASLLEVASPVGDNSGVHMFFYDGACTKVGDSVFLPLTVDDISFLQITGVGGILDPLGFFGFNRHFAGDTSGLGGLITLANSDDGFTLDPLKNPIHSRMYLFNGSTGRSRIVEPIILDAAESPLPGNTQHTWSPLRTAVTFFAPQENGSITTKLWLICPSTSIVSSPAFDPVFTPASGGTGPSGGFPAITPSFGGTGLRAVVFDTDEHPIVDIHTTCACVRTIGNILTDISTIYSSSLLAGGSFTKLETEPSPRHAFTGYRSISTGPVNDFFGRLSNGSDGSIDGRTPTGVVSTR